MAAAAGTALAAVSIFFYYSGLNSYDDIVSAADPALVLFPRLLFIGCAMLAGRRKVPFEDSVRIKSAFAELSDKGDGQFLYYTVFASGLSLFMIITSVGCLLSALAGRVELLAFVFVLSFMPWAYMFVGVRNRIKEKNDGLLADLPSVLSKLTLLISAGIVLRDAWDMTAASSERPLFRIMAETSQKMKNGMSEENAFYWFSKRAGIKEARQLANVLSQNLKKGGNGLAVSLRLLSGEAWAEKKQRAVILGKKAESKLLIPLMIMFAGIIMMIIVPLFAEMG
ncbi:MAG: type II secretion system F family protein [Clostridia bacterium]|nr:type II secretion system F family protein [Clostridia bacterium]